MRAVAWRVWKDDGAHELTQEGVIWARLGERRCNDWRAGGGEGGFEGVWVQRTAGKSDCGEACGGDVVVVVEGV